ncbi:alpha/beta fold hydrolase [Suttonella sp. R2A3]|uniref:alpha/beta hydrolase family protein n=1 Tax=Suttonella sp. R2A3 TaxID=2908648 RepID=UPI001F291511|nr:alpha/beta fold hydrolase [Suttonella sp. R2A3]UJF24062.1 alpha/beta fold hydrolase [Suttonella sp. R2A3]
MTIEPLTIDAGDGLFLAATLFRPDTQAKTALMIAPATGIKRTFYQAIATWLAEVGYGVITFDNHGIGESLSGRLKGCPASLESWGRQDMSAVFRALKQQFPDCAYHLIGHSAGGQLLGLMEGAQALNSAFLVASSSGCLKNMDQPFKAKAHFFMNGFIPLSNAIFGYTQSSWVGMGEPLPKAVAAQWATWCNGRGYVETAFDKTVFEHSYHTLNLPIQWIYLSDDEIACEANVFDMQRVFSAAEHTTTRLEPKDYGVSHIGHMRFFSRKSRDTLWPLLTEWLEKHI